MLNFPNIIATTCCCFYCELNNFEKNLDNRGGASEASGATLTGDVDGSSRYMYVCIYMCVKPLGQLLHAHAQMVLSQQFSKFIFTGKGNSGNKDLLLRSGT